MKHYNYHIRLQEIWQKSVDQYTAGQRGADGYFNTEELQFLQANGVSAQEMYDYAEDYVASGDPDFTNMAMVTDVRRSYFLEKMHGQPSSKTIDPATYPSKTAAIDGIQWLPRIIEKAKAKLHGELDSDTMYGCGGDRKFLKACDIHPAEFIRFVAANEDDRQAIIDWVKARMHASTVEHKLV